MQGKNPDLPPELVIALDFDVCERVTVASVTRDHLERLVETLEARVRDPEHRFAWKTSIHVWANVRKMFDDACRIRVLRVREDNPADKVKGPRRGGERAKQYLWPSEAARFMACSYVPRELRQFFAASTYLYARPEEIEALEWSDVDLEHGVIEIHRAIERVRGKKGEVKTTKTKRTQRVPIEATLRPLLVRMHADAGGVGRLFPNPHRPRPPAWRRRSGVTWPRLA